MFFVARSVTCSCRRLGVTPTGVGQWPITLLDKPKRRYTGLPKAQIADIPYLDFNQS